MNRIKFNRSKNCGFRFNPATKTNHSGQGSGRVLISAGMPAGMNQNRGRNKTRFTGRIGPESAIREHVEGDQHKTSHGNLFTCCDAWKQENHLPGDTMRPGDQFMTGDFGFQLGEPEVAERNACNEDGVDLTLIRWMLSLSLEERLQALQDHVNSIQMMRRELTIG